MHLLSTLHPLWRCRLALVLLGIVVLAGVAACGGDQPSPTAGDGDSGGQQQRYALPGNDVYPEGIARPPDGKSFYVGSTTDGTVFRGDIESGNVEAFLQAGTDGRRTAIGMDVDREGRLFIAGGDTGQIYVYQTSDGELIERFDTGGDETFINDVTVVPNGDAYFTNSRQPVLLRVPAGEGEGGGEMGEPEPWLDLERSPIEYEEGEFNLNGIASTPDGRYLVVVQSNTGNLYRIDTASKEVVEIDVDGAPLTSGDGLLLDHSTLYVVRNAESLIVPVKLAEDLSSGAARDPISDPAFAHPTTIAKADEHLLVVNSQFDKRESADPELPFNVSSIAIPERGQGP